MHHTLFYLKKLISSILLPLPLSVLLLIIGMICLLQSRHQRTAGLICCGIGTMILLAFSLPYLPHALLFHLERQYAPITQRPPRVRTIVVLGAGINSRHSGYPPNTRINSASLSRLIEGIRLYKLIKQQHQPAQLILSGGRIFGMPAVAGFMRNIARLLGVKRHDIRIEEGTQDTWQEAQHLRDELGQTRFFLVTSAYHLPRALWLFKSAGLHPIPAPTQYLVTRARMRPGQTWIPNAINLLYSDIAIHEYLGLAWAQWHHSQPTNP